MKGTDAGESRRCRQVGKEMGLAPAFLVLYLLGVIALDAVTKGLFPFRHIVASSVAEVVALCLLGYRRDCTRETEQQHSANA